ncbi:hypothetical protein FHU33_2537 [Blastococcus colisei]|uniref:Uncharacterized protein n=1 Tax=Blastococcus colisei TaxID=1564162 RepID=A0A543PGB6_9ACTN|nr:hypothetical protein [Blastococcus colisei]TQN43111.1 hypothetical protein FHU33_2537 [Blastococcus colisei]
MSGWLLPALVLVAALAATYRCCLRPMRGGVCHPAPARTPTADDGLQRQLRQARAERDRLRAQ